MPSGVAHHLSKSAFMEPGSFHESLHHIQNPYTSLYYHKCFEQDNLDTYHMADVQTVGIGKY